MQASVGVAGEGGQIRSRAPSPRLTSPFARKNVRAIVALLSPFVANAAQHLVWPVIHPFAWILFYPAVFFSAWIGGAAGGVAATIISTLLVWWSFVPPQHQFAKDEPRYVIAAAVFVFMGTLFSLFQGRLKAATKQLSQAVAEARRTEAALRESEANLKRAQKVAHVGSWYLDIAQNRLSWSDEVFRIFGIPSGTPMSYDAFLAAVHPDHRELVNQTWNDALRGATYDIEHRILVHNETRWVRERAQVEFDADRNPVKGIGTVQDITERRIAQARLLRINRANRALSKCNQVLIRAVDESKLLQQICEVVVQEAGYQLCWVGRAEHDAAKSVKPVAQAGRDEGYLEAVNITWADTERGRGPTGTCIRTGEITIAKDLAHDPRAAPWRAEALRRDFASAIAVPLRIDSDMFGAVSIYAAEVDAFGAEEIELLSELVSDLQYGIGTLRTRAQRARAEEELRVLNSELEQRVSARTAELQQAREREFEIGCRIQQTLLLDQPPTNIPGLRIAALTIPSQRIDGDFYVFVEPREGSLDVIVGDVMGKGIPAALLGAATKSHFLKALGRLTGPSAAGELPEPREIVMLAHAEIVRKLIDLESFVTLCYARIDTRRHRIGVVDCGHTGVILLHGETGLTDLLHGNNLPLGVREGEIYDQVSILYEPGDLLLLFSDGITEARNSAGELFGVERLQECVQANKQLDLPSLVDALRKSVMAFCRSARFNDDLTSVAIRLERVEVPFARAKLEVPSELQQLHRVREFVRSFCSSLPSALLDEGGVASLELAVNEAASNIVKHAYHGRQDQRIEVEVTAFVEGIAVLLRDHGDPFDPTTAPVLVLDRTRESGSGLYILRQSVDEVSYSRDERGSNCLTLVKFAQSHIRNEGETPWKSPSSRWKT